jgi:Uma2 family endonuclease
MVDTAAASSAQEKTHITLADFLATSADQPVEIVNGEMVVMSPTQRPHIRIAHRLYHAIYNFVQAHQLGSVWMETA